MKNFLKSLATALAVATATLSAAPAVADSVTYFHNDLVGSPMASTNQAGQVVWRETYRPYGDRQRMEPASSANEIWFTSRKEDPRTELIYMGARYYDPRIGRFLQPDPVGFVETNVHSFNRYAYANNNPHKYIDPNGKAGVLATTVGGAAAGTFVCGPVCTFVGGAVGLGVGVWGTWQIGNLILNDSGGADNAKPVRDVVVPSDKYPETAQHIQDAQDNGQPDVLTIDRKGSKGRRTEAMDGHPTVPGQDRDEYPPAMFGEGGKGSSVRPIAPSDNRGAGACMGAQCRDLPDGSRVRIVPK